MFNQLIINSLITGAIYSLVASGFSLIYSTCKFVHFAHGAIITLGAYFLFLFFNVLGLNFWSAVVLAIIFSAIIGLLMNKIIYQKFRQRKSSNVILLIASFSLLILFESLILIFFGADVKTIGYIQIKGGLEFLKAIITPLQIFIITTSFILLVFLWFFMQKNKDW